MDPVSVNYLVVLACGVAAMVIGSIWYGPLFGKMQKELMKCTPEQAEAAKKHMNRTYAIQFVMALVMAYVMVHSMAFAMSYLKISGVAAGLQGGLWNWLGFILPICVGAGLWDNQPWKLVWVNAFHYLVTLSSMGVIIALWN